MRFGSDQAGVSTVIGAILVAALIATVFAHVQLHHVPVWEARGEARHAEEVQARWADFQATITGTGGGSTGTSLALPLRPSGDAWPAGGPSTARVAYEKLGPVRLELDDHVSLKDVNETPSAWSENWVPPNEPITDVDEVYNFRLKIKEIGGSQSGLVRVVAQDPTGRYVGNLSVIQKPDQPQTHVFIQTTDGDEVVHYDNPIAMHISNTVGPYWIDLLDPEYRYDGLLEAAPKPLTFTVVQDVLEADLTISFSSVTGGGESTVIGGFGDPVDVGLDLDAGRLEHSLDRVHLVPQRWLLEHGALILAQSDGAVFQVPPALMVRERSGFFHLDLDLPVLEGEPGSVGGAAMAMVSALPESGPRYEGAASRLVLNLSTAFPDLWADLLTTRLDAAGPVAANHTVQTGPDWVRLEVLGPADDADVADLSLSLQLPRYRLNLGG